MIKLVIIIFLAGIIETFLFTAWSISANKKEENKSSILMIIYMTAYLLLLSFAITNKILLIVYAISCGIGNYLEILWEKRR
jgi:multidrug transporter EmrE-like cation transporter